MCELQTWRHCSKTRVCVCVCEGGGDVSESLWSICVRSGLFLMEDYFCGKQDEFLPLCHLKEKSHFLKVVSLPQRIAEDGLSLCKDILLLSLQNK